MNDWTWWFAWYPVRVLRSAGDCWVWLVFVQRQKIQFCDARKRNGIVENWAYR